MVPATDTRPTRRILDGSSAVYVVELYARHLIIRPKGSRRNGPAAVMVTPGAVYLYALWNRGAKKGKRRSRR